MAWTDEKVELLRQLWLDGRSASQCAVALGLPTRNAVIGKVHRLNLAGRKSGGSGPDRAPKLRKEIASRAARARWGNRPVKLAVAPPPRAVVVAAPLECLSVSLFDLNQGMCKWLLDDGCYCGNQAPWRAAYCEGHSGVAYQPGRLRSLERLVALT